MAPSPPPSPSSTLPVSPLTTQNLSRHNGQPSWNAQTRPPWSSVYDIPLPDEFLSQLPVPSGKKPSEFLNHEHLRVRYTMVSCRSWHFVERGHVLRPPLFSQPRRPKLLASLAISESDGGELVSSALAAVIRNVRAVSEVTYLQEEVWWKEIIVVLVGCSRAMTAGAAQVLRRLGVFTLPEPMPYDSGWAGQIYEYTTLLEPNPPSSTEPLPPSGVPCQLVFFDSTARLAVDEANSWVVRAFAGAMGAVEGACWISLAGAAWTARLNEHAFVRVLCDLQGDRDCVSILGSPLAEDRFARVMAVGENEEGGEGEEGEVAGGGRRRTLRYAEDGYALRAYRLGVSHPPDPPEAVYRREMSMSGLTLC